MAESDPGNSSTPPTADPAVHVGQDNPYKIGTPNDPVLVEEYCSFLVMCASGEYLHFWKSSTYYDKDFINVVKDWPANSTAAHPSIQRSGTSPDYTYTVIPGHNNDIIDGVDSEEVQEEFNKYREGISGPERTPPNDDPVVTVKRRGNPSEGG